MAYWKQIIDFLLLSNKYTDANNQHKKNTVWQSKGSK